MFNCWQRCLLTASHLLTHDDASAPSDIDARPIVTGDAVVRRCVEVAGELAALAAENDAGFLLMADAVGDRCV